MPESTLNHFMWSFGRLLQGKKQYASRGSCNREEYARQAERKGQPEVAALYRMCLAPHEWHALGYEGSLGSYRKVRDGVSLYEATNGAYGEKRDFAPVENLKRDLRALQDEYFTNAYSEERKRMILDEIEAIKKEIGKQKRAKAVSLAAE